jgi:hypothetical protein
MLQARNQGEAQLGAGAPPEEPLVSAS